MPVFRKQCLCPGPSPDVLGEWLANDSSNSPQFSVYDRQKTDVLTPIFAQNCRKIIG